jgi:hypothetical protein
MLRRGLVEGAVRRLRNISDGRMAVRTFRADEELFARGTVSALRHLMEAHQHLLPVLLRLAFHFTMPMVVVVARPGAQAIR